MAYNKAREERKWKIWKENEEKILKKYNMSEEDIRELRIYDWKLFNMERRYREKEIANDDLLLMKGSTDIHLPIYSFQDILEQLENEELYMMMKEINTQTMSILYLKICGFKNKEIAKILKMSEKEVSKRISKIRKKLKNKK